MGRAEFRPVAGLGNPHVQTILASIGKAPAVAVESSRVVPIEEGVSVRVDFNAPEGPARGTLLLVHGLAGSSESAYIRWSAWQALQRGWHVVRMNLRGCGGTTSLTNKHHNAFQSDDVGIVLRALHEDAGLPRPFAVLGFSLGANLSLRWAGLAGESAMPDALVAVNPPVDLDLCCTAIDAPANFIYRYYFVTRLFKLMRAAPHIALPAPPPSLRRIRKLRTFDDLYTAPHAGFPGAREYYEAASSGRYLPGLRIPTLVVSAKDDPFVPVEMFAPFWKGSISALRLEHPERGGHVGYRQRGPRVFWAAERALDFFEESLPAATP